MRYLENHSCSPAQGKENFPRLKGAPWPGEPTTLHQLQKGFVPGRLPGKTASVAFSRDNAALFAHKASGIGYLM